MPRARILSSFVDVLIDQGIGFLFYKYTLQTHATGTQIARKTRSETDRKVGYRLKIRSKEEIYQPFPRTLILHCRGEKSAFFDCASDQTRKLSERKNKNPLEQPVPTFSKAGRQIEIAASPPRGPNRR